MNYEVHVKQLAPQVVITERCHATLAGLGQVMQSTLAKVSFAFEAKGVARGAPFAVYHNEPFRPDDIDVEMGLPVAPGAKVAKIEGIQRRELPGGPVAYTVHGGPYTTIGAAYEALYTWIAKHGHTRTGPPREIYVMGPDEAVMPSELRTEIEVPID